MKKVLALIICCILFGCSNEKFDINERANQFIEVIAIDGINDLKVVETSDNLAIIKNQYCQIDLSFEKDKLVSVHSKAISKDDEYSCVFRTMVRDKDILGDDKQKNDEFLKLFRENKNFEIYGFEISNDFTNMSIVKK
ncbi:hypothetical protein OKW22_001331 [Bacilli bacterium PM5-3]|nr:hypothetical protein [Bacilli bacterium PM5-3]